MPHHAQGLTLKDDVATGSNFSDNQRNRIKDSLMLHVSENPRDPGSRYLSCAMPLFAAAVLAIIGTSFLICPDEVSTNTKYRTASLKTYYAENAFGVNYEGIHYWSPNLGRGLGLPQSRHIPTHSAIVER